MRSKLTNLLAGCVLILILRDVFTGQLGRGGRGEIGGRGIGGAATMPSTVSQQPPAITDSDLVLVNVSVTGAQNSAVAGISKDRFQILEDGVEQKITYFWEDSRPVTVGFIFDNSMRMDVDNKVFVLREAAQSFLKNKDSRDEFFVVRMSNVPDVAVSFTTDLKNLPADYVATGETALYDSIYVGLSVIKEAANSRRFLVVITSGGDRCCSDDNKTTTDQRLKEFALKQNVQIYSLFVISDILDAESEFVHRDAVVLSDLAAMTGGKTYIAQNSAPSVEALTAEIARGLKTQYIAGFKSTRESRDGQRRGIKVKVSSPERGPKLDVWTKAAYFVHKSD